MNVLYTGIFSKMGTSGAPTAFYTAIGGRLYHIKAPQLNATFPYAVYDLITGVDDLDFSDENEIFTIQFDIFSQNNSASEAGTILAALKGLYDDCVLTVTGWRHLSMKRDFTVSNNDFSQVPPIMGYSVQYEIELEKARS